MKGYGNHFTLLKSLVCMLREEFHLKILTPSLRMFVFQNLNHVNIAASPSSSFTWTKC